VGVADVRRGGDQLVRDQALAPLEPPALLAVAQLLARGGVQLPRDIVEVGFHFGYGAWRQHVDAGQVSDVPTSMRPVRPYSSLTAASSARMAGGEPSYPTTRYRFPAGGALAFIAVKAIPFPGTASRVSGMRAA